MGIADSLFLMVKIGILDVILPFALVFTLTYALFKRTNVFGRMNKRTSVIVALVTAFLFVGLFSFKNFIWMLFWMVLVFIAFLFYILLIKMIGLETKVNGFVIGSVFAIFALIASYQFVDINRLIRFVFNPIIITILLFSLLVWFIVHEKAKSTEKKSDEKKEEKSETKSETKEDRKEQQRPKYDYPKVPPEDIPEYDFEEVERIPGSDFEKEFHKKYPPTGREY